MDLLPLFQSFETSTLGLIVRQSIWLFPVIQCFHLLSLSLLGGTVLVLDMRLLGLGLQSQPHAELTRKVQPWLIGSLMTIIVTGILMFLSEAVKCYYSPPFWYKMGCLVAAILFTFLVRRRLTVAASEKPILLKLTALVSLSLWFGVAFSGRWIAFY